MLELTAADLFSKLKGALRWAADMARLLGSILGFVLKEIAVAAWAFARPPIIGLLNVLAALIVLFEEWGWRPLSQALARLVRFAPIAAIERTIAGLPPYGALVAFALPTSLLLPLKLVAVWLLANEYFMTATLLFLGAKIVSTALIARVFILTKPALMQIAWFARAYNWFLPWKEALFAEIRASAVWRFGRSVKILAKRRLGRGWAWMRLRAESAWLRWTGRKVSLGRRRPSLAPPTGQARHIPDP